MRRMLLTLMAVLALLVSTSPAQAAGIEFRFTAEGPGADAFWTTFPEDGVPEPNVVYTDTFLFTADEAVTENGEEFQNKFLFVEQFSFKFDRRGNFIPVSDTFGFAGGDDVSLTVDARRLTSAAVRAVVQFEQCDARGCTPVGSELVEASWTATGPLTHNTGTFVSSSSSSTFVSRFRGTSREASATGRIGDQDLGVTEFASIFNSGFTDMLICHHC